MAATIDFVQFLKTSGFSDGVSLRVLAKSSALGIGFFGEGLDYQAPPSASANGVGPVKAGTASWQVWTALRVEGLEFTAVSNIKLILQTINRTGLGTIAGDGNVSATIPMGSEIAASGLFVQVVPNSIELGLTPHPIGQAMPNSAPAYGLPFQPDGWTMMLENESLDLTPHRQQIGDVTTKAIYSSDPEDRFSNFAVMNFVLSSDATAGVLNPVDLGVTWDES